MTKHKRTDWRTPLDIPEGKQGDYAIEHEIVPAGKGLMLNTMRTMMFGQGPGSREVVFDKPTRWHHLTEDGARWICDWPVEQRQHDECLKGMKGRVLVGGLGIGYAATVLYKMAWIKDVTVVEISQEVIDLVAPHTIGMRGANPNTSVVCADLLQFLKDYQGRPFDHAFYDVWRSDGEGTFHETVVPLHQLSRGIVKNRPVCWNEDIMRGQLAWSLTNRLLFMSLEAREHLKLPEHPVPLWEKDGTDQPWHNWSVPFFTWWRDVQPNQEKVQSMAQSYAGIYGLNGWKHMWEYICK